MNQPDMRNNIESEKISYWEGQPIEVSDKTKLAIIKSDPSAKTTILTQQMAQFDFRTLRMSDLNEIYELINNHYVEDSKGLIRCTYGKDFLYWYLKPIYKLGLAVGLVWKNKLIGFITASLFDMIVWDKQLKVPYINFLCVHHKLRKFGLGP